MTRGSSTHVQNQLFLFFLFSYMTSSTEFELPVKK